MDLRHGVFHLLHGHSVPVQPSDPCRCIEVAAVDLVSIDLAGKFHGAVMIRAAVDVAVAVAAAAAVVAAEAAARHLH